MQYQTGVILVGQGEVNKTLLTDMAKTYPLIALDGGLSLLAALGLRASLVIGDMDSCNQELMASYADDALQIADQDTNDFEKALLSVEAPFFIGFGLLGGRFDHVMASLHLLVKYQDTKPIILISPHEVLICCKGALSFVPGAGIAASILPVAPIKFKASCGLEWPVDGLLLSLDAQISSSNHMKEAELRLTPDGGYEDVPYILSLGLGALPAIMAHMPIR